MKLYHQQSVPYRAVRSSRLLLEMPASLELAYAKQLVHDHHPGLGGNERSHAGVGRDSTRKGDLR